MTFHENCVVCEVGNGDMPHNPEWHPIVDYHAVDGIPTSEPCLGLDKCPDCLDVLDSMR